MIAVLFSLFLNLSVANTPVAPVKAAQGTATAQAAPVKTVLGGTLAWNEYAD